LENVRTRASVSDGLGIVGRGDRLLRFENVTDGTLQAMNRKE